MQNVNLFIILFQQMTSIFAKHIHAKGNKFTVDVKMEFYWKTIHL